MMVSILDTSLPEDAGFLDRLRERVRRLEGLPPSLVRGGDVVPLDLAALDDALPWGGVPRGVLHEVVALERGAATGFAALMLARLAAGGRLLWCLARDDLYAPGLGAFGLDPDALVLARAPLGAGVPWAMEEGLRSGAFAAVAGEVGALSLDAARRLQLAARDSAALLLRSASAAHGTSPAVTRWHVGPAVSAPAEPGLGRARWRVSLVRCRGGQPRDWIVEWDDASLRGRVVADLADRPGPAPARAVAA
jgi:protein ImuA